MLMPSIFGENLFDDFFTQFYYDDKDEKKVEKKLYGRRAQNLLKTVPSLPSSRRPSAIPADESWSWPRP